MYNSSATYPDHAGIVWYAAWSAATGSNYTIIPTGRVVKKYSTLAYAGVEFYTPNAINAGGMTNLHVDLWTPNANQFGIKLVSLNPTVDPQINITAGSGAITSNGWVSLDIPLNTFTAANSALVLSNLQQLLWVDNGTVGGGVQNGTFYIDNVYFWKPSSVTTTNSVKSSIKLGDQVSWAASSGNTYQPQTSADATTWVNLGNALSGSSVTSIFNAAPASFYRVQETIPGSVNSIVNGGFETTASGQNSTGALRWDVFGTGGPAGVIATAVATNLNPNTGLKELDIEAQGSAAGGSGPVVQQDGIPVSAGAVTLSFYVKAAILSGFTGAAQYQVYWYDSANNITGVVGFVPFPIAPTTNAYALETINLTAPAATDHCKINFLVTVGAISGEHWLLRMDDVSLSTGGGTAATNLLSATVQRAAGVSWSSAVGGAYQVQSRPSLTTGWSPFGANVTGTGTNTVSDLLTSSNKFYRVLKLN